MRYCASCKSKCDRKGQRYCKRCHNESMRKHRLKMKRERQAVQRFIQRVGIENGVVP